MDVAPEPLLKELSDSHEWLRRTDASMHDLVQAMDMVQNAVRNMSTKFYEGKYHPDEEWDLDYDKKKVDKE